MFVAVLPVVTSPPIRNVHFQMPGSTFKTEYSIPRCSNCNFPLESTVIRLGHGALAASIQNGADGKLVCPRKFSAAMWWADAELAGKRIARKLARAALAALVMVSGELPGHFRVQLSPCWRF
jgi:hypothetical protein